MLTILANIAIGLGCYLAVGALLFVYSWWRIGHLPARHHGWFIFGGCLVLWPYLAWALIREARAGRVRL